MENLSFQYPVWLIALCLLVGVFYAVLLYWKSRAIADGQKWIKPLLGFLRFTVVAILGILLLGPILKSFEEESKLPTIVFLEDVSLSVNDWVGKSSENQYENAYADLQASTGELYNVESYHFGDYVSAETNDSSTINQGVTNLSSALEYIFDIYEGENLGAVVLATDGIYNQGKNPLYSSTPVNIPVYSIALGDTSKRRDVFIQTILHNEVAYLNDEMVTQVDIKAYNAVNQNITLNVEKLVGETFQSISSERINISSNDFFTTKEIKLSFDQVGINQYRYSITRINNELNYTNNSRSV